MEKTDLIKRKNLFKWLFIGSLLLLVASSSILTYFLVAGSRENKSYANALQNTYSRNFNELSSNLNEIDVNLSKLVGTSTNLSRQKTLLTIWRDCFACQSNLSNLPIEHESVENTMSFVNKLGEYCYFLSNKLLNGENFTLNDLDSIQQLSDYSNSLNHDISLLALNVSNGNFDVLSIKGTSLGEEFLAFLDDLQKSTVETPSMIYDGPYSESSDEKEILGLENFECTMEEARSYLAEVFKVDESSVNFVSETSSKFVTYNFLISNKTYAQVTKIGKFLLQFNQETNAQEISLDRDQAIERGQEFLKSIGIEGMEANWVNVNNNQFMINYAYVQNGIVCYSDLIKIKLSGNGEVCGYEATSYAYNHTQRVIPEVLISSGEALEIVDSRLDVQNIRLCIIPKEFADEVLAYEVFCTYEGSTYYVYINATNGKEEEIFKVVHDENEGELVI